MRSVHNDPIRPPDDVPDSHNSDEPFGEIRKHLTTVRRDHVIVIWIVMVIFVLFNLIAIGLLVLGAISIFTVHEPADRVKPLLALLGVVSSGGIGAALLPFLRASLSEHRTSQAELAYFESLVAEARASLAEIPKSLSSEQRREIRAEIWNRFRSGLTTILMRDRKAQVIQKEGYAS